MKSICFRVDASNSIGMGHLMECIALTVFFSQKKNNSFSIEFIINDFPPLKKILSDYHVQVRTLGAVANEEEELHNLGKLLQDRKPDILICNLLNRSTIYYQKIRSLAHHTAVILDDEISCEIPADIVINFSILQDPGFYSALKPVKTQYCIGPAFMPLSDQFQNRWSLSRDIPAVCTNIFINQGGSDPYGLTLKIIRSLELLDLNQTIYVIMGDAITDLHRQELLAIQKVLKNRYIFEWGVSHKRMLEVMEKCDLAITAAGNTLYELAIFGIPSIIICHHERHNAVAEAFAQRGAAINLGIGISLDEQKIAESVRELLENQSIRCALSREAKKIVDGKGSGRIDEVVNRIW